MRILMLNHNVARRGGTFYRAYNVGRYLTRRGHTVTLLTISEKRRFGFRRELSEGVEMIESPDLLWGKGRTGWDPWDALNRILYLRRRTWDIVHAWDSRPVVILPALYARRQSRRGGGKLVIDWCDWWGRGGTQAERPGRLAKLLYAPVETFFEEAFRTQADGTTVISQALFERALRLGVRADTMRILPQGCDVDLPDLGDGAVARQRLGIPVGRPLVITVGSLTSSEAALLFDTLRLLFQQRPDCLVHMIGNHGARMPDDLKSSSQLAETGFISESSLTDYTAACDVMLTPLADTLASRARWPSKVNPFLAAGRVVAITRVGDLAALLEREGAAVVTDCTPEDMASNLIRLFENPDAQKRYGARARRVAQEILAWPAIIGDLESFYLSL